ncbi:MAG: hypothetical protein AB7D01_03215 [Methanoculleus sp.]
MKYPYPFTFCESDCLKCERPVAPEERVYVRHPCSFEIRVMHDRCLKQARGSYWNWQKFEGNVRRAWYEVV